MKKILILLIVLFLTELTIAQENDYSWYKIIDDPRNFWQDVHEYESYYKSEYPESIPEEKLGNIKDFYRFVNYWNSRLGIVDGELSYEPYIEAIKEFNLNPYCEGTDPAQWELLGPVAYSSQYLGLVDEVLGDPNNPNNFIIGSQRGGIWKNQTSGNSWVNVTDNLRLPGLNTSEIIRNKFNSSHIIASTGIGYHYFYYGLGLIQSFDNGNTWEIMETFPNESAPCVNKIIQDPYDNNPSNGLTLYSITNDKVYVSHNTGLIWTEIINPFFNYGDHNHYLDIEIADNGEIFISTFHRYGHQGNIYKYSNNQWYDLNSNNQFGDFQRAVLTTPHGGKIFMLCDVDNGNNNSIRKIYKTINYGSGWEFIKNTPHPGFKHEIEYSPVSNIVYVGDWHIRVFKDEYPYDQKNITSLHVDIRDFEFLGIDEDGYENVLTATDGGVTLLKLNIQDLDDYEQENLNGNYLPIGDFIGLGVNNTDSEFIVSGAVHCNSFRLLDGTWQKFSTGDGGDCEVNWFDPSIYYYQANNYMHKNVNGSIGTIYSYSKDWFIGMEYELNPNDPNWLYFGRGPSPKLMIYDENNNVLQTKYINTNMDRVGAIGITCDNTIYLADFSYGDPNATYRLIKSEDNCNTWQDLSSSSVYDISGSYFGTLSSTLAWKTIEDIIFNPIDPNEMWISIGGVWRDWTGVIPEKFRILHSTNGGLTFYDYSDGLSAFPVIALEYQTGSNNRLFAGTDGGIYYREPGMAQWECFSEGMPIAVVTDLDYDPCSAYLYASTTGRAIYKTPVYFYNYDAGIIIPEESLWSDTKRIFYDIVIPSGTTLTIQSTVYMYCNTRIIVEPGGKLIVDGGTITSGCDEFWKGIE